MDSSHDRRDDRDIVLTDQSGPVHSPTPGKSYRQTLEDKFVFWRDSEDRENLCEEKNLVV